MGEFLRRGGFTCDRCHRRIPRGVRPDGQTCLPDGFCSFCGRDVDGTHALPLPRQDTTAACAIRLRPGRAGLRA